MQVEIFGGKEYAPQSKIGHVDLWQQLFEESRVVLNNALLIYNSRKNGTPLLKPPERQNFAFKDVKAVSHFDAQAMVARCSSCGGGVDSILGKPKREVANIFECQNCGKPQNFGSDEVTQQLAKITCDDIRARIEKTYYCLLHYRNIINEAYQGNVQAFYANERSVALAGPYYDQSVRYPILVQDANRVFESLNRKRIRQEQPVKLDDKFAKPPDNPPQAKE